MERPTALVENARGATLFELRRMVDGWVVLDLSARQSLSPDALALLYCVDPTLEEPLVVRSRQSNGEGAKATARLMVRRTKGIRWQGDFEVEYNISDAQERLALLARLALEFLRRSAPSWSLRAAFPPLAAPPLLAQVCIIQLGFDLHVTEHELARRIGVDRTTIRRWFLASGLPSPAKAMGWTRCLLLIRELCGSTGSIDAIARRLGFSSPSNASRLMKRRTGLTLRNARSEHALNTALRAAERELRRNGAPTRHPVHSIRGTSATR